MFVLALLSLDIIHRSSVSGSVLASNFTYFSTSKSFEDAIVHCNAQSQRLASVDAPEEWDALIAFIHETNDRDDFWIALKRNNISGWYNWLDGRELGFVNFDDGIDLDIEQNKCIVIEYEHLKWKTSYCTDTHRTICYRPEEGVKPREQNVCILPVVLGAFVHKSNISNKQNVIHKQYYFKDNTKRNFEDAALICQQDGGHLPIIKSITDHNLFMSKITLQNDEKAWLGLTVSGNYYQWISGEQLEKYVWESNEHDGTYVHAHRHDEDNALIQIHAPNDAGNNKDRPYICQSPTPMVSTALWVHYRYVLLSKHAVVYIPPRQHMQVSQKTHCAMQCSRDIGCHRYSLDGSDCKTYGRSYYVLDSNGGGVKLFDRVEVRTPLV